MLLEHIILLLELACMTEPSRELLFLNTESSTVKVLEFN